MSLLQERLSRLKKLSVEPNAMAKETHIRQVEMVRNSDDKWNELGIIKQSNLYGSFMLKEIRYPLNLNHGIYQLGDLMGKSSVLSLLLSTANQSIELNKLLFFDTETTGLGSGAGNVSFMIGMGFYTQEEFIVEQLFIRNPGEERAMLHYLQDKFQHYTHLVTYNGKSFDWPIILNRYVIHRLALKKQLFQHLDLLYPSRSLWKYTLPSCRLGIIEEQILGIKRLEDVPGSLAPTLYFQYLAEGDPKIIEPVFLHNETDILSLAGLAVHLSAVLLGEMNYETLSTEEVFRLGLWLDKIGNDGAERAFEYIMNLPSEKKRSYLVPLAAVYKKKRNYARAVQLWHLHIDNAQNVPFMSPEPFIELSMYYEHHKKDIQSAATYAQEAMERAKRRNSHLRTNLKYDLTFEKLQKRIDRLSKKHRIQISNPYVLQLEWQP